MVAQWIAADHESTLDLYKRLQGQGKYPDVPKAIEALIHLDIQPMNLKLQ